MSIYKSYLKEQGFDDLIVNEAYFGKNKYLIQAEKIIHTIRANYKNNQIKVNSAKELLEFNRVMEKAFKFECFCLNISYSGSINACTMPISSMIDAPNYKNAKSNEIGFNYSYVKGSTIIVYINTGLLFNEIFTDAEILAVILHEIGHNFQTAISPMSRGSSYVRRAMSIVSLPLFALRPTLGMQVFKGSRKWYADVLNKWREEDNEFFNILNGFKFVLSKILGVVGVTMHAINNLIAMTGINIPIIKPETIADAIASIPAVKDESIADNFVTAYGYGPEFTSFVKKSKYEVGGWVDEKILRENIPMFGMWLDFCQLPVTILYCFISAHPDDAFRAKSQIDMLKKELDKNDIDPKMKGVIRKNIKEIEGNLDEIISSSKEGWMFTNALSAFLLTVVNGDFRSFVAKSNFDEFDKAYETNLENLNRAKR